MSHFFQIFLLFLYIIDKLIFVAIFWFLSGFFSLKMAENGRFIFSIRFFRFFGFFSKMFDPYFLISRFTATLSAQFTTSTPTHPMPTFRAMSEGHDVPGGPFCLPWCSPGTRECGWPVSHAHLPWH